MTQLKKLWRWFDDRTGTSGLMGPLFNHLVPRGATWWYVFGTATLIAFLTQIATGIALSSMYVPSAGHAYQSLQYITQEATMGRWLRAIHYWGASAMVLFVGIHMIRVFLTGAYKFPREMSWITGVGLLAFTLLMGFTGQLLRWDQNAIWSVVVGAEQAGRMPYLGDFLARFLIGGGTVGGQTLSRFFALHVFLVPAMIFATLGLHLYLVLRNGISEPPKAGRPVDPRTYRQWYEKLLKREGVPFWPNAAWRDILFGTLVVVGIVVLAYIFGPPKLDNPPNPANVHAHPHPDWYLLWYFAVLALLPHGSEDYVMILGPLAVGAVLLLLPLLFNKGERAPLRRPWAMGVVLMTVTMIGTLWIAGRHENWSPRFDAGPLPESVIGASSGPVAEGGKLFQEKACIYCHQVAGHGGKRGPDLTTVADRRTVQEMKIRIANGGYNMPAFAGILSRTEMSDLLAFLETRRSRAAGGAGPAEADSAGAGGPAGADTAGTGADPGPR